MTTNNLSDEISNQQREISVLKSQQSLPGSALPNVAKSITKSGGSTNGTATITATFSPLQISDIIIPELMVIQNGSNDGVSGATGNTGDSSASWWIQSTNVDGLTGAVSVTIMAFYSPLTVTFNFISCFGGTAS